MAQMTQRYYGQYYTDGTAARKLQMVEPEPRRTEEELPDYARVRKVSPRKGLLLSMNLSQAAFLAFAVFTTLGLCVLMLSMQTKVAKQNSTITTLQKQVEALTDDNNAYQSRIESSVNLNEIRDRAINELGMVYPTEGQVLYYDLTQDDYVRQYADIPAMN